MPEFATYATNVEKETLKVLVLLLGNLEKSSLPNPFRQAVPDPSWRSGRKSPGAYAAGAADPGLYTRDWCPHNALGPQDCLLARPTGRYRKPTPASDHPSRSSSKAQVARSFPLS